MSILGVDYGDKRVGLAIAHDGVKIATPMKVVSNSDQLLNELQSIVESERINTIVVGLPRALAGHDTAQTETVRVFSRALAAAMPEVVIELQDEAGTTASVLESHGKDEMLDARAASLILRDYLESQT